MMVRPRLAHLAAVAIAAMFSPSSARADAMTDAKDLFERGRELRGRADCASAVAVFRKAYEVYPAGLGSLRNLAECEESLGRFASARRTWLDLERALITNDDRKYEGWGRDAQEAAARLQPKVSKLTVDVMAISPRGETLTNAAIEVTLNGERLAPSVVGTALERDPGRYVIRVEGVGVNTAQEHVIDLAAGEARQVALRVAVVTEPGPPSAALPASARPPAEGLGEQNEGDATRRTMAWVASGVGVAGLVGLGVSAIVRQVALDDIQNTSACSQLSGKWTCQPSMQTTVDRGTTANALTNVFYVVAGVGVAGGIVLFATSHGHPTKTALVLSPARMSWVGSF